MPVRGAYSIAPWLRLAIRTNVTQGLRHLPVLRDGR